MEKTHALLTVQIENHLAQGPSRATKIVISGCKECLAMGIANVLLIDNDFKDLINRSVRMANEIKAKNQN